MANTHQSMCVLSNRGVKEETNVPPCKGGRENLTSTVCYYYKKTRYVLARSASNNATKDPTNPPLSRKKNYMSNTDQRLPAIHGCYQ